MIDTGAKLRISPFYDESDLSGGLYELELNDGLADWEIAEAQRLAPFARGVMLVTGQPGSGKGLFGTVLAWLMKRYFKARQVLLDYIPKRAFGNYILFNSEFMLRELNKMAIAAGTEEVSKELSKKQVNSVKALSERWVEARGSILLQNGVLGLDELKRYFHNRRPMNTLGVLMGHIVTTWRHLDLLIIGMTPFKREIDAISFLPYVTHWARCSWSLTRPETTDVQIFRAAYIGSSGIFETVGKPITIHLDGGKAREELGGLRYFDLYVSKDIKNLKPAVRIRM